MTVEVWWGGMSCRSIKGGRECTGLLAGIDVSKDFFSAAGLDREGEELFSGSYEMNSHGFSEFLRIISSHGERLD